jgi:hypothetical protein
MTDLTGEVEGLIDELNGLAPFLEAHHCSSSAITKAVAALTRMAGENEALRHDLERQMDIANAECNEAEGYRAALERIARGEFGYGSGAKPFFASPISLAVEALKARASSGDTE